MNLVHSTGQGMKLGAGVPALLELALEPCEDVIERKPALAWRSHVPAHASHADEALGHRRATGARCTIRGSGLLPCEAKATTRGCLPCDGAVTRRVLLRLCSRGGLGILLVRYAEDTGGDFVVNYCFVVLADDVDSEFLACNMQVSGGRYAWLSSRTQTTMSSDLSSNGSDSSPSGLSLSPLMNVPFELLTSLM